jgi:hypothetical protein
VSGQKTNGKAESENESNWPMRKRGAKRLLNRELREIREREMTSVTLDPFLGERGILGNWSAGCRCCAMVCVVTAGCVVFIIYNEGGLCLMLPEF